MRARQPTSPAVVAAAILAAGTVLSAIPNVGLLLIPVRAGSPPTDTTPIRVVAALFQPLGARAQAIADRPFNCSRYDAERTLDAFAERLRDEVDLARVADELRGVVATTLEPALVSVWMRP